MARNSNILIVSRNSEILWFYRRYSCSRARKHFVKRLEIRGCHYDSSPLGKQNYERFKGEANWSEKQIKWRKNKMISAKEDMKNAITLEEKRYDSNSLIEDTYENSELVNTIKTGEGMEI